MGAVKRAALDKKENNKKKKLPADGGRTMAESSGTVVDGQWLETVAGVGSDRDACNHRQLKKHLVNKNNN